MSRDRKALPVLHRATVAEPAGEETADWEARRVLEVHLGRLGFALGCHSGGRSIAGADGAAADRNRLMLVDSGKTFGTADPMSGQRQQSNRLALTCATTSASKDVRPQKCALVLAHVAAHAFLNKASAANLDATVRQPNQVQAPNGVVGQAFASTRHGSGLLALLEAGQRHQEQVRPLHLYRRRDASRQPVVDSLSSAWLGVAQQLCELRRAAKALDSGCVVFHGSIKHHV